MSPVRLGFGGVRSGVGEESGAATSSRRGVVAGSAARMAEEARRAAGPSAGVTRPSIALRSNAGVVSRRTGEDSVPTTQNGDGGPAVAPTVSGTPEVRRGAHLSPETPQDRPQAVTAATPAPAATEVTAEARSGGFHQAVQRLRKLFRGA